MPEKADLAGHGHPHQFISTSTFAQLAGIEPRVARRAVAGALAGRAWRGVKLEVCQVPSRGGAGGKSYEVDVWSLPIPLQSKWHKVAEHAARIEDGRRPGQNDGGLPKVRTITQEMRQALWAEYDRRTTPYKTKAMENLEALRFYESLAGTGANQRQRAEIVRDKFGMCKSSLYELLQRCRGWDPSDWLALLAPRPRGGEPRAEFTPDAWECGMALWLTQNKPTMRAAHRKLTRISKEQGWTPPTYSKFQRMLRELPRPVVTLKREGEKALSELYPAHERLYDSLNVNDIWCADGRLTDVMLRGEDGRPYRATIIEFMDVRSRKIMGYAIGVSESADLFRRALLDAIIKSGVLPREILIDNSRAFASKMMTGGAKTRFRFKIREDDPLGILLLLAIGIIFALPKWARSKPLESLHRLFSEMDRECGPAYLGNCPDARPENHDPRAAIPLAQYRKLLDATIADYHERPHRGHAMDGRSPRAIYEDLLHKAPMRVATAEQLALCTLNFERVKLDPKDNAVRVRGNRYWTERLADLPRGAVVNVGSNPDDLSKPVRVYLEDGFFCEAQLVDRVGFRSQQAAKDNLRARRHWEKGRKDQARALVDMRRAERWISPPGQGEDPDPIKGEVARAIMPAPNVAELVHPRRDLRDAEDKQRKELREQVRAAVQRHYSTPRN